MQPIDTLISYTMSLDPVARTRVGAILVYKRRIVAFGHNRYKSHPLQARFGKNARAIYLHAEIEAIRCAGRRVRPDILRKCTLYVSRIKRSSVAGDFILGMARPCSGCQRAIASFNIPRVFYTGDDQRIHEL